MSNNSQYEQEWAKHQELIKHLQQVNAELIAAEATRNIILQAEQQNQSQPHVAEIDSKIEQLRSEKVAAETEISAFELEVAKTNLEHAQWLSEQLPPEQEHKIDVSLALDVAVMAASPFIKQLSVLDDVSTGNASNQLGTYISENIRNTYNYVAGATREFVQGVMDKSDSAKDWQKDIENKEQPINEKYAKEISDTEMSLQKQLNYLEKNYENSPEKQTKKDELTNTINKVKEDIENEKKSDPDLKNIQDEKAALQKAIDTTKDLEPAARQRAIQEQREEFVRQQELERQKTDERTK